MTAVQYLPHTVLQRFPVLLPLVALAGEIAGSAVIKNSYSTGVVATTALTGVDIGGLVGHARAYYRNGCKQLLGYCNLRTNI